MASKTPIFRIFNPGGQSKEDAVEKRRAQLRRAQQVYRDRKTRYVKALEGDLASSRRREHQASLDIKQLEGQVKVLLQRLEQYNLSAPDAYLDKGGWDVEASGGQLVSPVSQGGSHLGSHPEWPQTAISMSSTSSPFSDAMYQTNLSTPRVCDLDQVTLGMKFVLKIEEPCLGHVHGDAQKPDEPSGHALTVTSQVLCVSSSKPPSRASLVPTENVSESILERLLALAPDVACEGEVTPIQAWNDIRRRPMLGALDARCVMNLAERLRDAAKCHGFGAVVDFHAFQSLVHELLTSRIMF